MPVCAAVSRRSGHLGEIAATRAFKRRRGQCLRLRRQVRQHLRGPRTPGRNSPAICLLPCLCAEPLFRLPSAQIGLPKISSSTGPAAMAEAEAIEVTTSAHSAASTTARLVLVLRLLNCRLTPLRPTVPGPSRKSETLCCGKLAAGAQSTGITSTACLPFCPPVVFNMPTIGATSE